MSEPDDDLDAMVRRVDPERWLSSRLVADPTARADLIALYAFDHEVARAPRVASNPLIGEMRLVWWGEVLDEIYGEGPVRRHPGAEALALAVRRRSLARADLEAVIEARYPLLDGPPGQADAEAAGAAVARSAAALLDATTDSTAAEAAGRAWALGHAMRDGAANLQPALAKALDEATNRSRRLSVAAFPAVAHATLARTGPRKPGPLETRLRLTWAALTGRV